MIHMQGYDALVYPHNPNVAFGLGMAPHQKVARLGPFLGHSLSSYAHLRAFVLSQIITYDRIVIGRLEGMCPMLCVLLLEISRLGWPDVWLSRTLRAIPHRHSSPVIRLCRVFGRALKHLQLTQLLDEMRPFEHMSQECHAIFQYAFFGAKLHSNVPSETTSSSTESSTTDSSDS